MKKYADCANCIHRVTEEKTYLETPNTCLVYEEELKNLKETLCKDFERKEVAK